MLGFKPFTINLKGNLLQYDKPVVMGIINVTPDSFYCGSRFEEKESVVRRVEEMIAEGVDWIDLGAYSSRPGAKEIPMNKEIDRLAMGMEAIRSVSKNIPVSIDTFRSEVAKTAVTQLNADIINDISGGNLDNRMYETVAALKVPYILMHMRGTPTTMSGMNRYQDVTAEVLAELSEKIERLSLLGVNDVIIDPGFGFAKTLDQNYRLLSQLDAFAILGRPVLAGMSRKSMLTRLLGIDATEALVPTAIVGALALERGAAILRVHDPREAAQAIAIVEKLKIKG